MGKLKPITIAKRWYNKKIAEYWWAQNHWVAGSQHILLNEIKALSLIWGFEFPLILQLHLLLHQKRHSEVSTTPEPYHSIDYFVRLNSLETIALADGNVISKSRYGYSEGKRIDLC